MTDTEDTTAQATDWQWFASPDGEHYTLGPYAARVDAVLAATHLFAALPGFYVCEARCAPVCCDVFCFANILDALDDRNDDLCDDPLPWRRIDAINERALELALAVTLKDWLRTSGRLDSRTFIESRNEARLTTADL